MLTAGLLPLGKYQGFVTPWPCRCLTCNNEVSPSFRSVRDGRGCRFCGARRHGESMRLESSTASAFMLSKGLRPLEPYPGTTDVPWRCECLGCGTAVTPRYRAIFAGQSGCRSCASVSRRILAIDVAVSLIILGYEVVTPYLGRSERMRCRHHCGREVSILFADVFTGRSRGCKPCARLAWRTAHPRPSRRSPASRRGYDSSLPGTLYLIENPAYRAWKIGIANYLPGRLSTHRRHGWTTEGARQWHFEDGKIPAIVERRLIKSWRRDGLPPALDQGHDGYSETVSSIFVTEDEIITAVEQAIATLSQ